MVTPNQELQLEQTLVVREPVCIDFMGPEVQPVLSTPALIMWLEMASRQAAGPLLQEDEETVGTAMDLKHLAPTPLGMKVTLKTRIVEVEGRRIRFQLEAFDEVEKIAEGWHERARVSVPRFAAHLERKRPQES
jgi:predicted thioesterase